MCSSDLSSMRTTLTLDEDVAQRAKAAVAKLHQPFKQVVNQALRVGLDQIVKPPTGKPYRTKPRVMGLRRGCRLGNIEELLAQTETK